MLDPARIYHRTPLFESPRLNDLTGKRIHFKMECYQPSLSFKLRGMAHLCAHHIARGQKQFVASSGGNAGYSLAYAAARLGGTTLVIVPETTPPLMQERIRQLGAKVQVKGSVWDEAHAHALRLADETGAVYVSPFDDPLLWEGHSSMIKECAEDMYEPDLVVVAVGGGGLLCGVMQGLEKNGWQRSRVLAAETKGAHSYHAALEAGELVEIAGIDSIAKSLGARKVAQEAFNWSRTRHITSFLCSDEQALTAMRGFADDFNVLVEPACGAALAATYVLPESLEAAENILVIACGGAGLDWTHFCT